MQTPSSTSALGCAFALEAADNIFTPEQFQGDEALMIQAAEEFSRKEVLPVQERLDAQEEGLMVSLVRKAGELGFCGPDTSEAYGGLGLSKNLAARMLEFLSLNGSYSVTIGITSGISQAGLNLFGTEAQKHQYLPKLTSGEQIGAYALSEPNSGSDALSMTTRADEKNGKFVLNGTKMWISNAAWADQFLVMAKIGGEQVTAFLIERGFPGVSVSREEHKMGLKGSSTCRLILEDAEVPLENLLHEPGKGHQVAFNALNIGRFKLSSMSMGPAREAMWQAFQYVQDRRQFGQSLANFGLIQKKMIDMAAWFYAAESVTYRCGADIDRAFAAMGGDPVGNRKAAEEMAVECSACKVMSTELESLIVDEALQVYGGYGFTEEFPLARIYRDARVSRIYEGTNEINRVFLADRLVRRLSATQSELKEVDENPVSRMFVQAFTAWIERVGTEGFGKTVPQTELGALSDLAMLHYAVQSAHARANQTHELNQALANQFENWARVRAAQAYMTAMDEAIEIPRPRSVDRALILAAALERKLPLR